MPKRTKIIAAGTVAAVALIATGLVGSTTPYASAAVPPVTAGSVSFLPSAPRLVSSPGTLFAAGQTQTFQVAGKTFGGNTTIPANATGVILSVSAAGPQANGLITVWTTDAGKPGTATVSFTKGVPATNVATVALNDTGKLNIFASAATRVLVSIQGYVAPAAAPAAPVVKTIGAVASKSIDVGGSIRTRATEFAKITLPAGTWDTRVLGGFTGLNNVNNTVPAGVTLTGTMVVQKGATMGDNFENNVTVGGITIPRSQSDTLTQDPTAAINTFITLTESTELTVKFFAYASNSSQAGSGELKANLQSATFVKVS